jgi:CheY-like chemotaxis protein
VVVVSQDDAAALYLSRRVEGYNFAHAADLEQARSMVSQGPVAAVVLDSSLEVGIAEARALLSRNQSERVPVVKCPLPSTRWISGGDAFASVLTKPITAESLFRVLDTVLSQTDRGIPVPGNGARPRFLLVDDDRGFVELIKRLLQAAGRHYHVESAYDGREALRKMARSTPNCVLLDLVLPEMNGFEVVAVMRKDPVLSRVPVVAITAATPGEDNLAAEGGVVSLAMPDRFRPGELTALLSLIFDIAGDRSAILDSDAGPGAVQPEKSAC